MSSPFQVRALMVEFGRRMYLRNYIGDAEGNLSTRLPDGRIMITPSGINKGYMKPEDMVICDSSGKKVQGPGKPSSEIKLHLAIYNWRPEIIAICHAHPPYATGYSTARIPLMRPILPEVVGTIGGVPLAPYGAPGSSDLPETLAGLIDRYDVFLLEAHGVLALGRSLEEAFNRIETSERYANILFVAEQLGPVKDLPANEIERLLKAAGRLNIKDDLLRFGLNSTATSSVDSRRSETAGDAGAQKKSGPAGYR
jgi:L-fuculose-phosphate aldolase